MTTDTDRPLDPLEAMRIIRDDLELDPLEKLLAFVLLSRSNASNGSWTWSQRRIARECGMARSTLQARLASLLAKRGGPDGPWRLRVRHRTVAETKERDCSEYTIEVARQPVHVDRPSGHGGPGAGRHVARQPGQGGPPAGHITTPLHSPSSLQPSLARGRRRPEESERREPAHPSRTLLNRRAEKEALSKVEGPGLASPETRAAIENVLAKLGRGGLAAEVQKPSEAQRQDDGEQLARRESAAEGKGDGDVQQDVGERSGVVSIDGRHTRAPVQDGYTLAGAFSSETPEKERAA